MFGLEQEEICPRCRAGRLRQWSELTAEEREVACRLSARQDQPEEQRKSLWCTRCWHEESGERPRMI